MEDVMKCLGTLTSVCALFRLHTDPFTWIYDIHRDPRELIRIHLVHSEGESSSSLFATKKIVFKNERVAPSAMERRRRQAKQGGAQLH